MVELLRHRQTKEAATAMFYLTPTAPHLDSTNRDVLTVGRSLPVRPQLRTFSCTAEILFERKTKAWLKQ
jgi:hypothetical protein